jgi:hypothetical protein
LANMAIPSSSSNSSSKEFLLLPFCNFESNEFNLLDRGQGKPTSYSI